MDLAEISERTRLPLRRLRYVLDHGVLPGPRGKGQGRGTPRDVSEFEAFGLATAALMMEAGLRRSLVARCMYLLSGSDMRSRSYVDRPLYWAFDRGHVAELQIGDGLNVRLSGHGEAGRQRFDTGWVEVATLARLEATYDPLASIRLDVGQLRQRLFPGLSPRTGPWPE